MKYLGISVVKYVHNLYLENYKILLKEIKDLIKWRARLCSRIEKLNGVLI